MLRIFSRVQLVYVGLAFAACIGLFFYQATYVWPMERCESHGGWWSERYRECATPMPISRFTGRLPGQPRLTPQVAAPTGQRVAPGVQSTSPRP